MKHESLLLTAMFSVCLLLCVLTLGAMFMHGGAAAHGKARVAAPAVALAN